MNVERTCMRLEDLHAKLLRHRRKEVETMVKLGILASSVRNSEHETNLGALLLQSQSAFQPEFRSSSAVLHSRRSLDLERPVPRKRYVAVLDTNNAFHVINRIVPKGCENIDPELRSFSRVEMDHELHRHRLLKDSRGEKRGGYNSGAAMTQSAFI